MRPLTAKHPRPVALSPAASTGEGTARAPRVAHHGGRPSLDQDANRRSGAEAPSAPGPDPAGSRQRGPGLLAGDTAPRLNGTRLTQVEDLQLAGATTKKRRVAAAVRHMAHRS